MTVLVTGGAGYIGTHTLVELLEASIDVVVVDNYINSKPEALNRVKGITGKAFTFYEVDLLDERSLEQVFKNHDIEAVIHFAGLKAVGESVALPLTYYQNNITARSTVGLSANGGNLEFYQNRVHSSSNQAIVTAINTGGFIAGNQLTGVGNYDGMQVINSNGLHILYNALYTTASNSALHINGNGVANIQRNIFQNGGTGYALYAQGVNRDMLTLNENLYYNMSEPFAQWDATILDDFTGWKAISLKDQKSANLNPEFLSPSELRLTRYNASLALNEPINMNLTSAQREIYEGVDYFGKPRGENSTWYMGIDQIKPQIFVETHPASVAACIGEKEHYLLVSSIVSLSAEPNYQWYFDGVEIPGAIYPILYLDDLGLGNGTEFFLNGVYSVKIGAEGGADPVWANEAAVYVIGETEIIRQPEHVEAQQGEIVVLSVGAHARFLPPNYEFDYQWYRYDSDNDRVTALANNDIYAGVHTDILSVNVANDDIYAEGNSYFFVEVYGQCGMARSINVHIVKEANYGLVLTAQPESADACENDLVILQVGAEPVDMTTSLSYQWYKDGSMLEDAEGIMGTNTEALVLTDIKTTAQGVYHVVVTDDQGGNTERSKDAYVTVSTAPELIRDIQNVTVNEGTRLTYTVQVTGQNLTFTWYHNDELLLETDDDTINIQNMDESKAGVYRCVVSNECGEVETSATVSVTSGGQVSVLEAIEFNEVSPNPASTELNVRYSANQVGSVELKVRDLSGREVMGLNQSAQLGMNNVRLDVSNLSNGVYIIELSMGTFTQTNKIVISK